MPKWKAEVSTVGKGRDAPNINPFLPPPVGRIHWSWNPFELFVCTNIILGSNGRTRN